MSTSARKAALTGEHGDDPLFGFGDGPEPEHPKHENTQNTIRGYLMWTALIAHSLSANLLSAWSLFAWAVGCVLIITLRFWPNHDEDEDIRRHREGRIMK